MTSHLTAATNIYTILADTFGISYESAILLFTVLSIWALVWKGIALWKSGRRTHMIWFVVILITNTFGLIPIIYLLINRGKKANLSKPQPSKPAKKK